MFLLRIWRHWIPLVTIVMVDCQDRPGIIRVLSMGEYLANKSVTSPSSFPLDHILMALCLPWSWTFNEHKFLLNFITEVRFTFFIHLVLYTILREYFTYPTMTLWCKKEGSSNLLTVVGFPNTACFHHERLQPWAGNFIQAPLTSIYIAFPRTHTC